MHSSLDMLRPIDELNVVGKRVLLRADLNVPLVGGTITDVTRIQRVIPAIRSLCQRGAKVIVMSHFGRPKGKPSAAMSLRPVADSMRAMLSGTPVRFVEECVGASAEAAVGELGNGEVALLENLRFHPEEEANDPAFARRLAALGDIYVNEAFSAAHRAHASIEAIAHLLPAYAGPSMMAEIDALCSALETPERPMTALVGGSKVSTKIPVLTNLVGKVETLIVGGAMANTFIHALGHDVGASLHEPELADTATGILDAAHAGNCEVMLPVDARISEKLSEGVASEVCDISQVPSGSMILDAGPASIARFKKCIAASRTLLWNGPLGAFEVAPFSRATFELAREAAILTKHGKLTTIAGGGDTVAALNAAGVTQDFTYVSTAGGAFLEWLEGRTFPGVMVLACNQQEQLTRSA